MIPKKIQGVPDFEDMRRWWEVREQLRYLISACLYHPDMEDPEGWLKHARDLIHEALKPKKDSAVE